MPVVVKAMELGALRHSQGFDAYEILKEYELLGGILFEFFVQAVDEIPEPCEKGELMACGARLFRAVTIIQQATMTHFLRLGDKRVADREGRLNAFNRVLSHEIKNRVSAVLGAGSLLREMPDMSPDQRTKLVDIVWRNANEMGSTVGNILVLSQLDDSPEQHRHVKLREAVGEGARQVREAAQAAKVEIRILPDIADVEVDAAVVELSVTNYLSNAIKYADPAKPDRFAEVTGTLESGPSGDGEVVIRVRDNGLGVPVDKRERLFERFFRAHETVTAAEGTGLGLSIVRETAESEGGRAWAEHTGGGSVFALALPLRKNERAKQEGRHHESGAGSAT